MGTNAAQTKQKTVFILLKYSTWKFFFKPFCQNFNWCKHNFSIKVFILYRYSIITWTAHKSPEVLQVGCKCSKLWWCTHCCYQSWKSSAFADHRRRSVKMKAHFSCWISASLICTKYYMHLFLIAVFLFITIIF